MESVDKTIGENFSPQIYSMRVESRISHRYARTLITSNVRNLQKEAKETTFFVIIPENAFISEFEMEIKGKVYKSYVKEKEEAKAIYQEAVSKGRSTAHVEMSARDSNTFTVSVNIEPESETIFRLTYEELLQRQNGKYELILNIDPRQLVEDLGVEVQINESKPLTFVKTPCLRSGNEIREEDEKLDPSAEINIVTNNSAIIKFNPDVNQQRKFAEYLGGTKDEEFNGQFVVQYDVERDPQGGEVLVHDGYFVHFFAPSQLEPLPKHVVFVLDHSGSMSGRKIRQLIEAMQNILSELNPQDLFNIVRFSGEVFIWNAEKNTFDEVVSLLENINLYNAVEATSENIEKAKIIVANDDDLGTTNIFAGLEAGLLLTKRTQEKIPNKYQPMILFLTDGMPLEGITDTNVIISTVANLNSGSNRTAIFSLSFGEDADKNFLKKLSLQNLGFSKHIYEAADASLQLQDFYHTISCPLLSNIRFKYVDSVADVTETDYPLLFQGSELIVTGRVDQDENILLHVDGTSARGPVTFKTVQEKSDNPLERLWAYLTIKKLLKQKETVKNAEHETEITKKALDVSLKYSFVTPVSSLVVVKPDEIDNIVPQSESEAYGVEPERATRRVACRRPIKKKKKKLLEVEVFEDDALLKPQSLDYDEVERVSLFETIQNDTFYERFRLTKETCEYLFTQIESDLATSNNTVPPTDQILITLQFYGSNGNVQNVADSMKVDASVAFEIIKKVSEILAKLSSRYVEMPKGEEIRKSQEKFYQLGGFPKVVGVISGAHIRIRPGDGEGTYRNQKGYFSIKSQIIWDADSKILDIFLQPGAQNEATVFNNSQIKTRFERGEFPNCVLLGNGGYLTGNYLLTSVKEPTTTAQQRYNESHTKTFNVLEKFFDSWIRRFPVLANGSDIPNEVMQNVIMATAVLHNLALNLNDTRPPPAEDINQDELENLINECKITEITKNDEIAEESINEFVNHHFSK